MAYTLDNIYSNDTLTQYIIENKLLNCGIFDRNGHIRCFGHCLNLAAEAIYSVIKNSIDKIRTLINKINNSIKKANFKTFLETRTNLNLVLIKDVPTRWNSTLLMLRRALKLKIV
jgi:hypothetical protein